MNRGGWLGLRRKKKRRIIMTRTSAIIIDQIIYFLFTTTAYLYNENAYKQKETQICKKARKIKLFQFLVTTTNFIMPVISTDCAKKATNIGTGHFSTNSRMV
jgi:hypothetical protein